MREASPPAPSAGPSPDQYAALLLVCRAELTGLLGTLVHLPAPATRAEETAQVVLKFRLKAARLAVVELLNLATGQQVRKLQRQPWACTVVTPVQVEDGFSLPQPVPFRIGPSVQ